MAAWDTPPDIDRNHYVNVNLHSEVYYSINDHLTMNGLTGPMYFGHQSLTCIIYINSK